MPAGGLFFGGFWLKVEIVNWEKYNPKRDQKNYSWFRLNNDVVIDAMLFPLDAEQKFVWISMLCCASKENNKSFDLNTTWLSHITGVEISKIFKCLAYLKEMGIILIEGGLRQSSAAARQSSVATFSKTRVLTTPTIRTNETNETNERDTLAQKQVLSDIDFEKIYQRYPRKVGKKGGLKTFNTQIKNIEDYEKLSKAVDCYAAYCKKTFSDQKYIKHFDTFMNQWTDWLDPDVGKSNIEFGKSGYKGIEELLLEEGKNLDGTDID